MQEAKRRQEQVDLTEQRAPAGSAAPAAAGEAEEEDDEQKQLADIRRQRAVASREADLAEQRLQQIADARAVQSSTASAAASAPPGNNGADTGLQARYAAALQEAILAKWTRPETVPVGARCRLMIRQLPGGAGHERRSVIAVRLRRAGPALDRGRRAQGAAAAVRGLRDRCSQRTLTLNFEAARPLIRPYGASPAIQLEHVFTYQLLRMFSSDSTSPGRPCR